MTHPDTLTVANVDTPHAQWLLLDVADRAIVRNEFVIAYEAPLATYHSQTSDRGYVTVWVQRTEDDLYERVQMVSGDNEWILSKFGTLASGDTDAIEQFVGHTEIPQP